jgi:hypothetical protein
MIAERPTAAVFGALAALAFIIAFAAAAVLRPEVGVAPAAAGTRTAPTATREGPLVAGLTTPGLSRVAGLPGLRLPVVKHKRHAHRAPPAPAPAVAAVAPVATAVPTAVPTPVATAAPVVVHTTAPAKPTTPNVGQSFDSSG